MKNKILSLVLLLTLFLAGPVLTVNASNLTPFSFVKTSPPVQEGLMYKLSARVGIKLSGSYLRGEKYELKLPEGSFISSISQLGNSTIYENMKSKEHFTLDNIAGKDDASIKPVIRKNDLYKISYKNNVLALEFLQDSPEFDGVLDEFVVNAYALSYRDGKVIADGRELAKFEDVTVDLPSVMKLDDNIFNVAIPENTKAFIVSDNPLSEAPLMLEKTSLDELIAKYLKPVSLENFNGEFLYKDAESLFDKSDKYVLVNEPETTNLIFKYNEPELSSGKLYIRALLLQDDGNYITSNNEIDISTLVKKEKQESANLKFDKKVRSYSNGRYEYEYDIFVNEELLNSSMYLYLDDYYAGFYNENIKNQLIRIEKDHFLFSPTTTVAKNENSELVEDGIIYYNHNYGVEGLRVAKVSLITPDGVSFQDDTLLIEAKEQTSAQGQEVVVNETSEDPNAREFSASISKDKTSVYNGESINLYAVVGNNSNKKITRLTIESELLSLYQDLLIGADVIESGKSVTFPIVVEANDLNSGTNTIPVKINAWYEDFSDVSDPISKVLEFTLEYQADELQDIDLLISKKALSDKAELSKLKYEFATSQDVVIKNLVFSDPSVGLYDIVINNVDSNLASYETPYNIELQSLTKDTYIDVEGVYTYEGLDHPFKKNVFVPSEIESEFKFVPPVIAQIDMEAVPVGDSLELKFTNNTDKAVYNLSFSSSVLHVNSQVLGAVLAPNESLTLVVPFPYENMNFSNVLYIEGKLTYLQEGDLALEHQVVAKDLVVNLMPLIVSYYEETPDGGHILIKEELLNLDTLGGAHYKIDPDNIQGYEFLRVEPDGAKLEGYLTAGQTELKLIYRRIEEKALNAQLEINYNSLPEIWGEDLQYSYFITNTGNVPIDSIAIKDRLIGYEDIINIYIRPGETIVIDAPYLKTTEKHFADGISGGVLVSVINKEMEPKVLTANIEVPLEELIQVRGIDVNGKQLFKEITTESKFVRPVINGFSFIEKQVNGNTVDYIYKPETNNTGQIVLTIYEVNQRNEVLSIIRDSVLYQAGPSGEAYSIVIPEIEGFTYKGYNQNAGSLTGAITQGETQVELYYTKDRVSLNFKLGEDVKNDKTIKLPELIELEIKDKITGEQGTVVLEQSENYEKSVLGRNSEYTLVSPNYLNLTGSSEEGFILTSKLIKHINVIEADVTEKVDEDIVVIVKDKLAPKNLEKIVLNEENGFTVNVASLSEDLEFLDKDNNPISYTRSSTGSYQLMLMIEPGEKTGTLIPIFSLVWLMLMFSIIMKYGIKKQYVKIPYVIQKKRKNVEDVYVTKGSIINRDGSEESDNEQPFMKYFKWD